MDIWKQSIKSNTIKTWLDGLNSLGEISKSRIDSILDVDHAKFERLGRLNKEHGLPIIKTNFYIEGKDFNDSNKGLEEFLNRYNSFAFRAVPKDASMTHVRRHNISREELIAAITNLPGGTRHYSITLNEFFVSEYAGTIISDGENLFIEVVHGDHSRIAQYELQDDVILRGLKVPGENIVFNIDNQDLRDKAINAVNFLKNGEKFLTGYFEFKYNSKDDYVFIDYNDSDFYKNLENFGITKESLLEKPNEIVSGAVVCNKNVSGKVRIVKNPNDSRFVEGEIIVAEMATPDFLPIMVKAKAVVTDLGGVTSHAALVCRELGIACIMGTKKATATFKDGDQILVDGKNGVVRKIIADNLH